MLLVHNTRTPWQFVFALRGADAALVGVEKAHTESMMMGAMMMMVHLFYYYLLRL